MLTSNPKLINLHLSYLMKRTGMMQRIISGALSLSLVFVGITGLAQEFDPVDWSFDVEQDGDRAILVMTAEIEEGWHIYSQFQDYEDGPLPTEFVFNEEKAFILVEGVQEPDSRITKYDPNFELDLSYFETEAAFRQEVTVKSEEDFNITGTLMFMTCNGVMCLAPEYIDMVFEVEGD